jgi:hypothetical protein
MKVLIDMKLLVDINGNVGLDSWLDEDDAKVLSSEKTMNKNSETYYKCRFCNEKAYSKVNMNHHILRKHSDELMLKVYPGIPE